MAGPHTTAERRALHVIELKSNGLPRIRIPEEYSVDEGRLQFSIPTEFGPVEVIGWRDAFSCKGTAPALEAADLLQADWLPGAPGNGRERQMVVFSGNAPQLVPRVTRKLKERPHILIYRDTKGRFVVDVPADEAQRAIMEQQRAAAQLTRAQHLEEQRAREVSEAIAEATKHLRSPEFSVSEFRSRCLGYIDAADQLLNALCQDSRFTYDAASLEKISHLARELRAAASQGVVVAEPSRRSEGNVVHLTF